MRTQQEPVVVIITHRPPLSLSLSEWVTQRQSGLKWSIWFLIVLQTEQHLPCRAAPSKLRRLDPARFGAGKIRFCAENSPTCRSRGIAGVKSEMNCGWIPFSCVSFGVNAGSLSHCGTLGQNPALVNARTPLESQSTQTDEDKCRWCCSPMGQADLDAGLFFSLFINSLNNQNDCPPLL